MFCAPEHVFGGTEGVGARFQVLRSQTLFGCTVGVRYRLKVLRSRTRFWRYRGRQVPFKFCAPVLDFDGTEGVGSRF
jgi:hypothetical protein